MPIDPPTILAFEIIDSTNSEAHRQAAGGRRGPLWIRADQQQQGRGRSGRQWSSPPGNLSATLLFTPACDRTSFHQLSFAAGVAVFDALAPHLTDKNPLQLKWPNDLLIGAAKVGGILVESSKYATDTVVTIGIGLNIAVTPAIESREVTRLDQHGTAPSPAKLLEEIAAQMEHWLAVWDNGRGFAQIRSAWLQRAHPAGQALSVNTNDRHIAGTFQGLAENGAMLLSTGLDEILRIEHGDVSLAPTVSVPETQP